MISISWKTQKRKIKELIHYKHNPRTLTEKEHKDLKESLKKFDLAEIPAINTDNNIIAGHQRIKIMAELYDENHKIDVRVPSRKLTKKEFKEYLIRSNKNTGSWDMDALVNNFDLPDLIEWGFDEVDFENTGNSGGLTGDDDVPALPKKPKAKLGDLYTLGEHRLLCGDSTDVKDVEKLMRNQKADTVFTDPPYGVDYSGKNEMLNKFNKGNHIQKDIRNDKIENYKQFFTDFLTLIPMADYNTCFISMSGQELHSLRLAFENAGFYWSDYLVWVKNNHVLGRKDYNAKHEFILYGWKKHHKFYGKSATTILEYDRPVKSDLHPTMKPIALIERLINDGCKTNSIVYDCFGGSGSTLIACEKTDRKCRMMELDPVYCDVILKRWSDYTGKKWKLINGNDKSSSKKNK